MLPLISLIGLLIGTLIGVCEGGYYKSEFLKDGWGNGEEFLYPQMTAACNHYTIAVYHYSVGGVDGQAGISLMTDSGMLYRRFPTIEPSWTTVRVPSPYQFINDPFVAEYPYGAEYMYCYWDTVANTYVIEMIVPIEEPINGGYQMHMVGLVIDYFGYYVRNLTSPSLVVTVPYQPGGHPLSQLTIQHNPSTRQILIGGPTQAFTNTIDLTNYWHHAIGCMNVAADIKVVKAHLPGESALVVLLDDSTQSYPMVRQMMLIINPYNGVLLDKIDTGIYYDINQLIVSGRSQLTVTEPGDDRIYVIPPSTYQQRAVHRWGQNSPWGSLLPPAGYVESVWFTNLGYLQGQTVLSDSTIVTTKISGTSLSPSTPVRTISILLLNSTTRQVLSEITTITGLTPAAISAGAVSNIDGYLFVAVSCDANDHLYLSNYWQRVYPQAGRAPGILIITKTGQFVDWYTGSFSLPQYVSFSRQGHMLVPDRYGGQLHVIDLTTRLTISTHTCDGCNGIAIDNVNGGYVVTTHATWQNQAKIRFMDNNFDYNYALGDIPFTFYNSYEDQAALSNPVIDNQGRIYVLASVTSGQSRSTAELHVYHPTTRSLILSHNWANPQPRGWPGISQLNYGLSLSINNQTQAIVATTIDFGQLFITKPL